MKRLLASAALLFAAGAASAAPMSLDVNTHFDQGWPLADFAKVSDSGADAIRDTITWGKVEQRPGDYEFTSKNSGYVDAACKRSIPVLLMIAPRNKLYDGGMAVFSPAGQIALARYAGKLVDRFPCVIGIEIGNEINTASNKWPDSVHKPAMYVSMLRAVRQELNRHPRRVALIGGSSIGVSVDFHARLFAAGELPLIDAVAVHPYIKNPELLPGQFAKLRSAMAAYGPPKAIWATEFGNYYKSSDDAPPHALKVMTIMSAAGVQRAFWYALVDEPWYPNMGLYKGAAGKPGLDTYRIVLRRLLPSGNAHRIASKNPSSFVYRFGNGPYVMWGFGEPLHLPSGARVFDARGHGITAPARLGPEPIIVLLPGGVQLG
jgi:hypothetical protein